MNQEKVKDDWGQGEPARLVERLQICGATEEFPISESGASTEADASATNALRKLRCGKPLTHGEYDRCIAFCLRFEGWDEGANNAVNGKHGAAYLGEQTADGARRLAAAIEARALASKSA